MFKHIYYVKKETAAFLTKDFKDFNPYTTIKDQFFLETMLTKEVADNWQGHRVEIMQSIDTYLQGVSDISTVDDVIRGDVQNELLPRLGGLVMNPGHYIFRDDIHGSPYFLVAKDKDVVNIQVNYTILEALKNQRDFQVAVRTSVLEVNQDVMHKQLNVPFAEIMKRWKRRADYGEEYHASEF